MVATIARAASADYYMHSQASFRPADQYYTAGEEPDGVWWNPSSLFTSERPLLAHGAIIDSADFYKLYNGFHPATGEKLTQNAGSEKRCPAYDITFNADKTVSALWAIAPPALRSRIEHAHNDAVRVALEDIVREYCSHTRIRDKNRNIQIVPADLIAGLFQHGAARSGDPHLHTHCVVMNAARAHHDRKWRALHGGPLYSWQKAAGAVYRAELAWLLRQRLGIEMEPHGRDNAYTRVAGIPGDLVKDWSKRDIQIKDTAARFGVVLEGKGALHGAIQRMTRVTKEEGVDPEERHLGWIDRAREFVADIGSFVQSLLGETQEIPHERLRAVTRNLDDLPSRMTHHEAVVWYNDIVQHTADAGMGLLSREARNTAIARVLRSPELIRLDKPKPSPDAAIDLAHTRPYTSAHNLQAEKEIHRLATELVATEELGIAQETVRTRIDSLVREGYPLSDEQIAAISFATSPGRIAIVEGAAGSGKTTTLRPLADLYREQGCKVIATAVAWRTAVSLGGDLDAPTYAVDKLIRMVARGRVDIDDRTLIVVDEAGMLSSAHARRILELAHDRGAKIVFAGDTEQQQPVTAGPGLRLIRDVAGSARVDRIRRQKPDLEDVLVSVHGQAPETARLAAAKASPEERRRILADYDAMPEDRKPGTVPWQVTASEAFRDADAASAIDAYDTRGRFHVERDLDRTLTRLVDDWHRYRTENPDGTAAVLAQSNAEASALSFLMRDRALGDSDAPRIVIQACRGRDPRARPSPLEIAIGDRIRIGATQWEKQLFNGTMVTVHELREAGRAEDGSPVAWIRGRTDEGRDVAFRHDEIRDYQGKIRLDYGYALTIASAQGLTVDRTFFLANQRPARETIYPAATRHREQLDFYIDRKPLELEIREQRPEDEAGEPVTDAEIKAHLAERWSRLQPKEAAADYMSPAMREEVFSPAAARLQPDKGNSPAWIAANDSGDGRMTDLASRMRYTELEVRHGAAAEHVGNACAELSKSFASWQAVRETDGNAAVAMDPAFQADFQRSVEVLREAAPLLKDDSLHGELLQHRGGIEAADVEALADSHRLARSIRDMARRELNDIVPGHRAGHSRKPAGQALIRSIARDIARLAPVAEKLSSAIDIGLAPAAVDLSARTPATREEDQVTLSRQDRLSPAEPSTPDLYAAYTKRLVTHFRKADAAGIHPFDAPGWDELSTEIPGLLERPHLAPKASEMLTGIHNDYLKWKDHPSVSIESATQRRQTAAQTARSSEPDQPKQTVEPDPDRSFKARLDLLKNHFAKARAAGIDPSDAPGWEDLSRGLPRLLEHPDIPSRTAEALTKIHNHHLQRQRDRSSSLDTPTRRQQPADQDASPKPVQKQKPAPRQEPADTAGIDRFFEFERLVRVNKDAAKKYGLHPFDTPGWPAIARMGAEFVRHTEYHPVARKFIASTLRDHREWQSQHAAQIKPAIKAKPAVEHKTVIENKPTIENKRHKQSIRIRL